MLFLGIYATMMINVSDYAREHTPGTGPGRMLSIYTAAILPVTLFMGLIGIMVSGATGVVDPIEVFANAVDNTPLLVVTLIFIAFAQVTTNVLNNVVPPTYVLMDIFKLPFRAATVLVGLLAFATFPWLLVREESADGLQIFVQTYSAFLGPIFAVMVVDYYVIRKRTLDLRELYNKAGSFRGINYAAVIAITVGIVAAFTFSDLSFYAGLVPAGICYYLLMKFWPACKRFLPKDGTPGLIDSDESATPVATTER